MIGGIWSKIGVVWSKFEKVCKDCEKWIVKDLISLGKEILLMTASGPRHGGYGAGHGDYGAGYGGHTGRPLTALTASVLAITASRQLSERCLLYRCRASEAAAPQVR